MQLQNQRNRDTIAFTELRHRLQSNWSQCIFDNTTCVKFFSKSFVFFFIFYQRISIIERERTINASGVVPVGLIPNSERRSRQHLDFGMTTLSPKSYFECDRGLKHTWGSCRAGSLIYGSLTDRRSCVNAQTNESEKRENDALEPFKDKLYLALGAARTSPKGHYLNRIHNSSNTTIPRIIRVYVVKRN